MVSPSLLNPDWGDLTKFKFNPDFDLGMSDFLPWDSNLTTGSLLEDERGPVKLLATPGIAALPSSSDAEIANNPHKRLRLSLPCSTKPSSVVPSGVCPSPFKDSTNQPKKANRFAKPVSSPERETAAKGVIPANTKSNTQWAVRTFNAWALNHSFIHPSEAVPADLLESQDSELICKWLSFSNGNKEERRVPLSSYQFKIFGLWA